jgi:ABC-type nitrate/sulfonate/bicarbonate transport system substrate-binding protein
MKRLISMSAFALLSVCLATPAQAGSFSKLVGPIKAAPMKKKDVLEAPFLTWGGDVATFHANGGAATKDGSIYNKLGLKVKSVNGDDFVNQVKRYMAGETPLLRGTVRMIGMASEVLNSSEGTKPVMFLHMTWSAGDHMVGRKSVGKLNDLKGKKVCLQQGGPHVGMLDDILHAARLKWSDITVVWAKDLTASPNSPAEMFRKDPSIDACLVISPDMAGLCGGLDSTGTGTEKTIKGSRVVVSTAQMSRSIADVYACRKDYYDANKATISKFTSGYLKACESIVDLKKAFESGKDKAKAKQYMTVLQLCQDMFTKEVIPTLEADAHGLISDCTYVGLPGNVSFFTDSGNLSGFAKKTASALKMATEQGYAKNAGSILNANLDYAHLTAVTGLTAKANAKPQERFPELSADDLFPDDPIKKKEHKKKIILNFVIYFQPNQKTFDVQKYGNDFQRAIESSSTFGNAVFAVGGHGDPTLMLRQLAVAGLEKGNLKRSKVDGAWKYTLDGKAFDLNNTAQVITAITAGKFAGTSKTDPHDTLKALKKLSDDRSAAVKQAIMDYAKSKGVNMDASQLKTVGVGAREPVFAKPTKRDEALKNMRVEFRLVKVKTESIKKSDFDF